MSTKVVRTLALLGVLVTFVQPVPARGHGTPHPPPAIGGGTCVGSVYGLWGEGIWGTPVTLRSRLVHPPDVQSVSEGVWLAGFWAPDATAPALAFTWGEKQSWFPLWVLGLHSDRNLLPGSITGSPGDGLFTEGAFAELEAVRPQPGHTYEVVLSYDPGSGALAANLYDMTAQRTLYQRSFQAAPYAGPLYPGVGGGGLCVTDPSDERTLVVHSLTAQDGFVPAGTTWLLVEETERGQLPIVTTRISRAQQVTLLLQGVGTQLPGRFTLVAETDTGETELASFATGANEVEVPVALPLGRVDVRLRYQHGELVWWGPRRSLHVVPGSAEVRIATQTAFGTELEGYVEILPDSDVDTMRLVVHAVIEAAGEHGWEALEEVPALVDQTLRLMASEPTRVPFAHILPALPDRALRVRFDVESEPPGWELQVSGREQQVMAVDPAQSHSASGGYTFESFMSREVLENYLSRAITMTGLADIDQRRYLADNIRMVTSVGAKFLGRAAYVWGAPADDEAHFRAAKEAADLVHQADPQVILQAGIFEAVYEGISRIPIPEWVFAEFGEEPEVRNFDYEGMLFSDGRFVNHWASHPAGSVPDMSRLETKMWFFYRAKRYIDAGYEALHLGQVHLMNQNDPGHQHWQDILGRIRSYASEHARRRFVLIDAHTHGVVENGKLLFDFHSFPLRIGEVPGAPHEGILTVGRIDSIYRRSKGGFTPSGWHAPSLPYIVELDNWGASGRPGQHVNDWWTWGYDEISWFAHQPEAYRNQWLRYAWDWVRTHDPNGWLQMPGMRMLAEPVNGITYYYAVNRSVVNPQGFNQEDTIREIWSEETP